jgi:hypothetical protein
MRDRSSELPLGSELSEEALVLVHGGRRWRGGGRVTMDNSNFGIQGGLTLDDFNTVIIVSGNGSVVAGRDINIREGGRA